MDSFEVNKIIGALLGVVFVIFSVSLISDAIFASPAPEKPGYAIEAMEGAAESGGGAEEEKVEDIKPMLASADVEKGAAIFKRCSACHTDDKSGANKVGPNLWGVVGRPIASHEGFSYSAAMKEFSQGGKEHWTYDHLNNFLHDPKKVVPGTAMGFAGLPKAEDRANVIAYLRTQADEPQPLPSPEEMAKEGGDKAAAEGGEGGEKAGAEGGEAAKAGEAAEGADAAKAPADKTEGAAQGSAPAAGTDQQGTTPEAGAEEGNAPAATGQQDGTGGEQVQPENQNAPAAESSTTESGTSGSGQRAEPDASNQDEPNANTPTTDSDEVERNQGEGSGSAQ